MSSRLGIGGGRVGEAGGASECRRLPGGCIATFGDAAAEHVRLASEPLYGQGQLDAQLVQIRAAEVAEFDVLEIVPEALVRVEIGRVAGQLLQLEARGGSLGEEVFDWLGPMNRRPIPNHEELPGELAQQVLQETDNRGAPERLPPLLDQQPARVRQRADDREVIAGTGHAQDGRLAAWRVGAHQARQQIEAGLVYPDNRTPLALGFAKRAGQRSVHHWAMAASLRWVARRIGFWTLQSSSRRSRLIEAGW